MIELNKITERDFLNREQVKKLSDVGIDMSDARYYIVEEIGTQKDYIRVGKPELGFITKYINVVPTYSTSELQNKVFFHIFNMDSRYSAPNNEVYLKRLIDIYKNEQNG